MAKSGNHLTLYELNKLVRARIKASQDGILEFSPYGTTNRWQVTLKLEIWPEVRA
jgi:hypothetical protein